MGRTARVGLFCLMGLVVALARLVEVEIGKGKPEAPPPLAVTKDAPPKEKQEASHPRRERHPKSAPARVAQPPRADAPPPPTPPAEKNKEDVEDGAEWPKGSIYTVKKGETLGVIAKRVLGSSTKWEQLLSANAGRISDPRAVRPGTKLVVPTLRPDGAHAKLPPR